MAASSVPKGWLQFRMKIKPVRQSPTLPGKCDRERDHHIELLSFCTQYNFVVFNMVSYSGQHVLYHIRMKNLEVQLSLVISEG